MTLGGILVHSTHPLDAYSADYYLWCPDLGTVESMALLSNSRDNGFTGVNLYCDDEASFVDAPPNPRASEIAFCCGKQMQVGGH